MGIEVLLDMLGYRCYIGMVNLEKYDELYWFVKKWFEGESIKI